MKSVSDFTPIKKKSRAEIIANFLSSPTVKPALQAADGRDPSLDLIRSAKAVVRQLRAETPRMASPLKRVVRR